MVFDGAGLLPADHDHQTMPRREESCVAKCFSASRKVRVVFMVLACVDGSIAVRETVVVAYALIYAAAVHSARACGSNQIAGTFARDGNARRLAMVMEVAGFWFHGC